MTIIEIIKTRIMFFILFPFLIFRAHSISEMGQVKNIGQRVPHRAKARPTRTLNNPKGLLGFCAAVVER
jgi:hypothetical protein